MSISFQCEQCGKKFETGDESAGKTARCKQCGNRMKIPAKGSTITDAYDIEEPPLPPVEALPPLSARGPKSSSRGPAPKGVKASKPSDSSLGKTLGGVGGVLFLILVLVARGYRIYQRTQGGNQAGAGAQQTGLGRQAISRASRTGPIAVPPLPDVGPGRELAPGITFHEVRLPGGPLPGSSGRLWLYLPSGKSDPKSLPCVLITGAGSNLLTGMELADGDRAEHLPYVRAGFAVLGYELDGPVHGNPPSVAELDQAVPKFLAARAGLVNAHIALEFLLAKVPQVDPGKIYTAGHSSAGVMAMLFAANEPRIKACVAYAPAVDLEKRFGPKAVQELQQVGIGDLATLYSPKNNESKLSCPIFLFQARDDSNVPVVDVEACADRLKQLGKSVTLVLVPTGGHYDAMIRQGIPRAIKWLQNHAGMTPASTTDADVNTDERNPAPPAAASPRPQRPAAPRTPPKGGRMAPRRKPRP